MADLSVFPGMRYSRLVAWLKWLLPMLAASLLLVVGAWPQLRASLDRLRESMPSIDLREARDLQMAAARYVGVDRENRPFTVTAEVARQSQTRDDLVSLEAPKADIALANGAWVALHAMTGIYRSEKRWLDLFGDVSLFHDKGMAFVSESAEVDLDAGTAEGREPVVGHGPTGEIEAEGFQIVKKGDLVVFTGRATAVLSTAKESAP